MAGWTKAYAMKNPDDMKPSATLSSPSSIARVVSNYRYCHTLKKRQEVYRREQSKTE